MVHQVVPFSSQFTVTPNTINLRCVRFVLYYIVIFSTSFFNGLTKYIILEKEVETIGERAAK